MRVLHVVQFNRSPADLRDGRGHCFVVDGMKDVGPEPSLRERSEEK